MIATPTETESTYVLQDHDHIYTEGEVTVGEYHLRVRDLPLPDRPREKMLAAGPHALSVAELVATLWGVGTKREEVLTMAKRTLREYGEKAVGNELSPERLAEAADIPMQKACQLVAAFELGRRYYSYSNGRPVHVRNLDQAFDYIKDIGLSNKEQLRGLYLNSRYQVIHDEVISVGSLTANIVHPREVFQPAIEHSAVAVIIAHNHPSGVLEPTPADLEVTTQLRAAGELLGIPLLDHLIVSPTDYISILEERNR
jgi:DNA repair protein RadC